MCGRVVVRISNVCTLCGGYGLWACGVSGLRYTSNFHTNFTYSFFIPKVWHTVRAFCIC